MARVDPLAPAPRRPGALRQFFTGVGFLARGFARYRKDPGLAIAGIVPAIIAAVVVLGALATLIYFAGDIATAATPFADHWSPDVRDSVHLIGAIALVGVGLMLAFITFTSVTLAIGDPFYEKISKRVEDEAGGVPGAIDPPWWRTILRDIGESVRLLVVSALIGVPLFLAGFIPVVGQTVVPVIGALVGGWFLAVELVGVPFARRGLRLRDRRRAQRAQRPLAVGFGAAVFVCFLVPFVGAIITMPAAVAGGTLLARRVLDAPDPPR